MGHPTNDVWSSMLNEPMVSHLVDGIHRTCLDCIHGKMSRLPFPKESTKCLLPFEKIHFDI